MLRSRLFSRPGRASLNSCPLRVGGEESSYLHFDYQLPCVITTHVPHSFRDVNKAPPALRDRYELPLKSVSLTIFIITCIGVMHIVDM